MTDSDKPQNSGGLAVTKLNQAIETLKEVRVSLKKAGDDLRMPDANDEQVALPPDIAKKSAQEKLRIASAIITETNEKLDRLMRDISQGLDQEIAITQDINETMGRIREGRRKASSSFVDGTDTPKGRSGRE